MQSFRLQRYFSVSMSVSSSLCHFQQFKKLLTSEHVDMQVAVHVHQDDGFDDGSFHNAPCVVSLRYQNENPCGSTTLEQTEVAMTQISFYSPGKNMLCDKEWTLKRIANSFKHASCPKSQMIAQVRTVLLAFVYWSFISRNWPQSSHSRELDWLRHCWLYVFTDSLCVVDKSTPSAEKSDFSPSLLFKSTRLCDVYYSLVEDSSLFTNVWSMKKPFVRTADIPVSSSWLWINLLHTDCACRFCLSNNPFIRIGLLLRLKSSEATILEIWKK